MCILIFSTIFSETFLILRRAERDMVENVYRSSCKVPLLLSDFELNLNFLDRFSKNTQITILMKISPVGTELFPCGQTEGQKDRHEATPNLR